MTIPKKSSVRPSLQAMINSQESMLGTMPANYGAIETMEEALEAAVPKVPAITLRVHIIWDNEATNFPLQQVLDQMRETGAAAVLKVEQVS